MKKMLFVLLTISVAVLAGLSVHEYKAYVAHQQKVAAEVAARDAALWEAAAKYEEVDHEAEAAKKQLVLDCQATLAAYAELTPYQRSVNEPPACELDALLE